MQSSTVGKKTSDKAITALCVSSFFCLTLFFFGPAHLYLTNAQEYSSPFSVLCFASVLISVVSILLLMAVLALCRASIFMKAISLMLALSLLLWLQGNILVWDYGPLDGREIDWTATTAYGLIDGGIWIAVLILAFLGAKPVCRIAREVSFAFLLIQLISLMIAGSRAPDVSTIRKEVLLDEESIFGFSPERNVAILVLDSFQGDVFQEIIRESPHYADIFDGFTYYRNSLGGFPYTGASVPLILTGKYYENDVPFYEFLKGTFLSESVPKLLTGNGYKVDLIGAEHKIYADESVASSNVALERLSGENTKIREATFIFDVALFRFLPHFLKKYVYNKQAWFVSNLYLTRASGAFPAGFHRPSIQFMKRMARDASADSAKSTFKYIHLTIPHFPIRINENIEYVEMPGSRANYRGQAKGTLEITRRFFEKLKSIGVYDKTTIFVVADHGAVFNVDMKADRYTENSSNRLPMMNRIKTKAFPVFLVKPFGSKGELKISDAPVSLADIAKTICTELNLGAEVPGTSIFSISETDIRSRRFLFHELDLYGTRQLYFAPMKEYMVSGLSWMDESWHPTYRLFTSEGVKDISPTTYQYGTPIEFGKN